MEAHLLPLTLALRSVEMDSTLVTGPATMAMRQTMTDAVMNAQLRLAGPALVVAHLHLTCALQCAATNSSFTLKNVMMETLPMETGKQHYCIQTQFYLVDAHQPASTSLAGPAKTTRSLTTPSASKTAEMESTTASGSVTMETTSLETDAQLLAASNQAGPASTPSVESQPALQSAETVSWLLLKLAMMTTSTAEMGKCLQLLNLMF